MLRLILRDIRSSLGRWIAIFAIMTLGTGFLAGLMQTSPAMLDTIGDYVRDTRLYDWWLTLPGGIDEGLLARTEGVRNLRYAESAAEADALITFDGRDTDAVMRAHSITDSINLLTVLAGRLPSAPNECLADSNSFTAEDIGKVLRISDKNDDDTKAQFACGEYTIVGIGTSPIYINYERGSSHVGNGTVSAFLFLPRDGFAEGVADTDLFLALETDAEIYSEAYDRILRLTQRRLQRFAEENLDGNAARTAYAQSRNQNAGFVSFESDAAIVAGIARVFPLFFFLVAALICVTTMTRMVDEQRGQIGILRALGFGPGAVLGIYLCYSGSAAALGCIAGFFLGTRTIPHLIWKVYDIMYEQGALHVTPNYALGAGLTVAFVAVSCLATALAVARELRSAPAQLLRPRPPKAGRRLLIERVPGLAGRLDTLWTVTLRNILRDRGRLLMTVVGVAGCTALLLAAYGIRDSIAGIVDAQFRQVSVYDYMLVYAREPDEEQLSALDGLLGRARLTYQDNMDFDDGERVRSVIVAAGAPDDFDGLLRFHRGDTPLAFPETGEVLICPKLAETCRLDVGDGFVLRTADGRYLELVVSGIFDNYFYNYAVVNADSFTDQWGRLPERRTVLGVAPEGADLHRTAAALLEAPGVVSVVVNADSAERVAQMFDALRYIVLLVIFCSGALAFIVLYNLTNINIIERIREIATVKVLGFRARETAAYVFRENVLLAAVGAALGLPLGRALHRFVMAQIKVDLVHFTLRIAPASYLWSLLFTAAFVVIVDTAMYFRLERIHMAEALKSNE